MSDSGFRAKNLPSCKSQATLEHRISLLEEVFPWHIVRMPKSYVFNLLYGDRRNCLCSPDYSWTYSTTVVSQQRRLLNPRELSCCSGVWHRGLIVLELVITRILKFLWIKCNFSNVSINSGNGGILVGSDISHIEIAPHRLLNYSTCLYE